MTRSARTSRVAAVQCALGGTVEENVAKVEALVRAAREEGRDGDPSVPSSSRGRTSAARSATATSRGRSPARGPSRRSRASRRSRRSSASRSPSRSSRRPGHAYYNSLAMVDADGTRRWASTARATSPTGPATRRSSTSGPATRASSRGTRSRRTSASAICWDQWFPEAARAMMLAGADVLLYPTAIGSEPENPSLDTRDPWQRAMLGHAVCNVAPVVAANRVGERGRAGLLRLVLHREPARREARRALARGGGRRRRDDRPRRRYAATARPGASSATGGPTSTAAS